MPNQHQLLFLLSFTFTFLALFYVSKLASSQLKAFGYDINDLILWGLPKKISEDGNIMSQYSWPALNDIFVFLKESRDAQLVAIVVAVCSSVYIFLKLAMPPVQPVLNADEWQEYPLKEKIVVSPNTAIYRFALPHEQAVLGLPIGQHISVQAEINGKQIVRSYTPISSDDDLGFFDLLVKTYEKGNISRYLSLLKLGDNVRIKGPKGQFKYTPELSTEIGMIAGGTGITPMLQILRAALHNPLDRTKFSLIYANVNVEDILCRTELDELVARHPLRINILYVLNNPPPNWKGGVGFVTRDHIKERLPSSAKDIKIVLCGPPPMMTAMKKHLEELKYPAPNTVSKLNDQVFLF